MWIEEVKNANNEIKAYKYIERYVDPLTGKMKRTSINNVKNTAGVRKEMAKRLNEKIVSILSDQEVKEIMFKELSEKWLAVYKGTQIKESTYNSRVLTLNVVNRKLGKHIANRITSVMVNNYLLDRLQEVKYSVVNNDKWVIENILAFGRSYGYVDKSNTLTITLPKINVSEKSAFKYLETNEVQSVVQQLEAFGRYDHARLVQIQVSTGMRVGELLALDYNTDIDLENETISITKTYHPNDKKLYPPKNGKSRTISIDMHTKHLIQEQISHTKKQTLMYNIDRNNTLLFKSNKGNYVAQNSLTYWFDKIEIEGKHITSHIFRHTFITRMVENGIREKYIAEHVGHSNTDMIQRVYTHFTKQMSENLKEAIQTVKFV